MHVPTLLLSLFYHILTTNAYYISSFNADDPSLLYTPSSSWFWESVSSIAGCPNWSISQSTESVGTIIFNFQGVAVDIYGTYPADAAPAFTVQIDVGEPTYLGDQAFSNSEACEPFYSNRNLTNTVHKVTLGLTSDDIRNFRFLGYSITIPDPGDLNTTATATSDPSHTDNSKRKIIIIAASCGAGAGFLISLFLVCCCGCCCSENKPKPQRNRLQKRPMSSYTYQSTGTTLATPGVGAVGLGAAVTTAKAYHSPGNSTTSPNPWSSSMSMTSATPSTSTRTTTANSNRPLTIDYSTQTDFALSTPPRHGYRQSLPARQPPTQRASLLPLPNQRTPIRPSSMLSQTGPPSWWQQQQQQQPATIQQQQPPPQYQPGLLGVALLQTASKLQAKGEVGQAKARDSKVEPLGLGNPNINTEKRSSFLAFYPIVPPAPTLPLSPNPVRKATTSQRHHSNPVAPSPHEPDWENTGEVLD